MGAGRDEKKGQKDEAKVGDLSELKGMSSSARGLFHERGEKPGEPSMSKADSAERKEATAQQKKLLFQEALTNSGVNEVRFVGMTFEQTSSSGYKDLSRSVHDREAINHLIDNNEFKKFNLDVPEAAITRETLGDPFSDDALHKIKIDLNKVNLIDELKMELKAPREEEKEEVKKLPPGSPKMR